MNEIPKCIEFQIMENEHFIPRKREISLTLVTNLETVVIRQN